MRVTVVGAGVIGLTAALRLAEARHEVRVVAATPPTGTTSAVAAAIWYPYRAFPREDVLRWSARTYQVLESLASVPGAAVRMCQGRELFREPPGDPWWKPAVPALEWIDPDRLPSGYTSGLRLAVPVVDMPHHLAWLAHRLGQSGVPLRWRRIDRLDAVSGSADVVINCTGLGARNLLPDHSMVPVRGQTIVVEQFGLTGWLLDQSDESRLTYVVPREDTVVLGGTAEEGSERLTPEPATAQAILQRCTALVPAAGGARIIAHRVGLRPGRPSVRLEVDASGGCPVVHCYGHGGAGVTLSYGCAEDVVRLVETLCR
jgi:D-amino-acid oxidase